MTGTNRPSSARRQAFKTALAKDLRTAMTDAERRLWSKLRRGQLGARFRRQQPIGPYIADFYCAAARLVVEVDGGQHNGAQRAHDTRRDRWLRDEGYAVLRFWNTDVLANTDGVLTDVMLALEAVSFEPRPLGTAELAPMLGVGGDAFAPGPPLELVRSEFVHVIARVRGLAAMRREPLGQACLQVESLPIFSDDERPFAFAFIWSLDGQRHGVSVASDYGQATITQGARARRQ